MPQPLKRNTLKEQAYQALRDMIASHRFSSGTWINAEQLAKELGVSRTPVWQALKQLEAEGLVKHEPNRGVRMVEMTPEMAVDLYEVRGVLEGLAASLMAANPPGAALGRMEKILARQKRSVDQGDSVAYSRTDFEFHQVLYEACGNWLLGEQLDNIKSKARPFVRDISPILPDLFQDHSLLVQALKKGDAAAASQAMVEHNRRMRRLVENAQLGKNGNMPASNRAD
ncbi:MAG: GntR family transcriptional regulator [Desulfarculaceae bacterium]|nr:GntR family transcriptional regulator [Desulfarculaceae bacterium]